jgi:hypothetical protein
VIIVYATKLTITTKWLFEADVSTAKTFMTNPRNVSYELDRVFELFVFQSDEVWVGAVHPWSENSNFSAGF